jgi:hypothetical protein
MKPTIAIILLTCFFLSMGAPAFGGEPMPLEPRKAVIKTNAHKAEKAKEAMAVMNAFRVTQVKFSTISMNNQTHLVAGVIFNKTINAGTVQQNNNIRLLRKNQNNFWVDASTQNNTVQIRPNFITWVCGAPIEPNGVYKMHLRGTIKSTDGQYLDCNGDGKGEGGNLPAFESQTYSAPGMLQLDEIINR